MEAPQEETQDNPNAVPELSAAVPSAVELQALIYLANNNNRDIVCEMHTPQGGQVDLDNPAQHMSLWLVQNWGMLGKMFSVVFTEYQQTKTVQVIQPSELKLVAADGQSLVQH